MSDMPETIWANTKSVWSKFELPATNKGEQTSGRKCAPRTKYIRADLVDTYNPETHILIAKDEVPQVISVSDVKAAFEAEGYYTPDGFAALNFLEENGYKIIKAAKMGDE